MDDQREVHGIIPPLRMCAWRFEWRSVWQALVSVSTCVLYDDINTRANHTHNVHIFIHTRLIDGRFSPGDGKMLGGGGLGKAGSRMLDSKLPFRQRKYLLCLMSFWNFFIRLIQAHVLHEENV